MKTHTDTPETRALWHETLDWCQKRGEMHDPYHAQLANLSEKLERERDEAREQRDRLLAFVESLVDALGPHADINGSSVIPAAYNILTAIKGTAE